jgi:hypothetical protein
MPHGAGRSGRHLSCPLASKKQVYSLGNHVNLHLGLTPLISLIAGILILVMPKLLNFIVAAYLIVIGLVGLFGTGALHLS